MLETLLASLIDGVLIGVLYGLAAMGLTLIFGVMRVVNLAHGPLIAVGMFGVYYLSSALGLHPYLALPLIAGGGFLLGLGIYAVAVHRLLAAPHLSTLLSTFAVNMVLIGIGTSVFSTSFRNLDWSLGSVAVGPIRITGTRLAASGIAILATAGLYGFLFRTRLGWHVRAVESNRGAAALVGIDATRVMAIAFALGTSLAVVAGGLIATILPFTILSGANYELKSFIVVVLGGLGNPVGALIGGVVLGLIEGLVPVFMKTSWVPVLEFVLFVLILLVRPQGLLGKRR